MVKKIFLSSEGCGRDNKHAEVRALESANHSRSFVINIDLLVQSHIKRFATESLLDVHLET